MNQSNTNERVLRILSELPLMVTVLLYDDIFFLHFSFSVFSQYIYWCATFSSHFLKFLSKHICTYCVPILLSSIHSKLKVFFLFFCWHVPLILFLFLPRNVPWPIVAVLCLSLSVKAVVDAARVLHICFEHNTLKCQPPFCARRKKSFQLLSAFWKITKPYTFKVFFHQFKEFSGVFRTKKIEAKLMNI